LAAWQKGKHSVIFDQKPIANFIRNDFQTVWRGERHTSFLLPPSAETLVTPLVTPNGGA